MSLVGTRPPTVDEWEQYELHHRSRMSIKPGITGMWQASGRSDITDFEEVVKLDTEYIEKEWYDGYRFGNVEVYCPWDVINYCDLLRADPNALPQDYWSNTSGNAMVRRFIDKADTQTRDEIERLIAGDEILKEIHQELTYNELDSSIEVMLG